MGMGFGAAMGEGEMDNNELGGAGSGGAAGVEPIAVIIVHKGVKGPEGVKVMSLKAPDPITRAINELGNAAVEIMGMGSKMMKECDDKKEKKIEIKAEQKKK